jgi:hypothetical protein
MRLRRSTKPSPAAQVLAGTFSEFGLWSEQPAAVREQNLQTVAAGGYPFGLPGCEEFEFFADGEELAEGGVEEFLGMLRYPLMRYGVNLAVSRIDDGLRYMVTISGRRCVVLDDAADPDWLSATVRPLVVVNALLEEVQATRRIYLLSAGGNDGIALLLPPAVVTAMRESGLFDQAEIPAEPDSHSSGLR